MFGKKGPPCTPSRLADFAVCELRAGRDGDENTATRRGTKAHAQFENDNRRRGEFAIPVILIIVMLSALALAFNYYGGIKIPLLGR